MISTNGGMEKKQKQIMSCLKKTKDGERCVGCLNGVKYLKM